ncbi:uncharacterized protein DS421_7g211280 [Arachis hypogaea]|nr:uncharacterized protein DS421_7g211280 [Arachis hypogaea]
MEYISQHNTATTVSAMLLSVIVEHSSVGHRGAQHSNAPTPVSYSAEPTSFCHLSLQGQKYKISETNDVSDGDGEDDDVDAIEDEDIGGFQF